MNEYIVLITTYDYVEEFKTEYECKTYLIKDPKGFYSIYPTIEDWDNSCEGILGEYMELVYESDNKYHHTELNQYCKLHFILR